MNRQLLKWPGPPSAFESRPVVLLSVWGSRSLLVMNPLEIVTSKVRLTVAWAFARRLVRFRAFGR